MKLKGWYIEKQKEAQCIKLVVVKWENICGKMKREGQI
jgi:hypothetical protein